MRIAAIMLICQSVGACAVHVEDLREEFVKALCFPAIQCNAIYENVYLLGEFSPSWLEKSSVLTHH